MKSDSSIIKTIIYIFAAIGLIATIGLVGMWIMHKSMMGRTEGSSTIALTAMIAPWFANRDYMV